jgi:hypothetical protein
MRRRIFWISWPLILLLSQASAWAQIGEALVPYVVLDSVIVEGNRKTRISQVTGEMNIRHGDRIAYPELPGVLDRNQQLIYNTGLFNNVIIKDTLVDNRLILRIRVSERWYIWPELVFNLEELTVQDWIRRPDFRRLTYGLGLNFYNFTGRNDKFYITYTQGYTNRIEAGYDRPFFKPKKLVGGGISAAYWTQQEVIYGAQTDGTVNRFRSANPFGPPNLVSYNFRGYVSKRFTQNFGFNVGINYRQVAVSDSVFFFNPRFLTNDNRLDRYSIIDFYLWYDSRDVRAFPLRGTRFLFSVAGYGLDRSFSTAQFAKAELRLFRYIPIKRTPLYFAVGGVALWLAGNQVPFTEKFFLRSAQVRGFNSYVIDGSVFFVGKTELKYELFKRRIVTLDQGWVPRYFKDFPIGCYPFVFFDAGYTNDYTWNNLNNTYKNSLLAGTGFGFDVPFIYDNLFRFEVAFNNFQPTRPQFLINYTIAVK